ncbi:delta-lactam-biosynthetic de-N-acetylase [Metabacillus sp. GX 13764]|uniref:delta-lactam-biosynthetic de-N-acetylase n=1 Tax=Metabacillus kandeliae TaxID=2900151 RepID=UPI001E4C0342|nr:delta-lactam-biosynthetic de-N-acetylase [Metabacillus kandeliae]MCD7036338.1 delta-lactam-biosynthetic de-N-acetylase [Metabacillus kandeliae]
MKKWLLIPLTALIFLFPTLAAGEVSNRPVHWGFSKSRNHQTPVAGQMLDQMIAKYGSFYTGDTSKKDIYLTFDNGYEKGYTGKILDVLKKHQVPATFFVTGHYLNDQPELVKRMVKEGHIIGNHSWHHPDMTQISDERLKEELESVRVKTEDLTGQKGMKYLRPPRGIFSERVLAESKKLGYDTVFWSLAFVDWKTDQQRGWKYAYDNMMNQIHPGAILLLHTVSKDNAEALDIAVTDLEKQGYRFKSLDDLMMKKHFPKSL